MLIPNRAFNVEKAAELINGQVVKPGATWSFNDTVGDRNEKNGWKLAYGIFSGSTLTEQYGGGICQVSTTLYNALLEAYPYFDFSRRCHSFPSTYVDKGLDATVDTDHIDFTFTNNSDYPVYIFAYVSKNSTYTSRKRDITVLIYGKALPDGIEYKKRTVVVEEIPPAEDIIVESKSLFIGEEEVLTEARTGYVVDVYVDRYLDGVLQESYFLHEDTYDGNPKKIRVGTQATPTPVIEPTPTPIADDLP
jgi:vancomycin resistance protein YoaR